MNATEFPTHLSLAEALAQVLSDCSARAPVSEVVPIESALGRRLTQDVVASLDLPPFANSAMDGFALRSADLPPSGKCRLRIVGTLLAGAGRPAAIRTGECLRIMTGAVLPEGADSVVIKERVSVEGDELSFPVDKVAGANVRAAGEDYRRGETALHKGQKLGSAHLAVLAGFGMPTVTVTRRPRVVLCTSGDELVAPGISLGPGQIHNTNRYALAPLIEQAGAELVAHRHLVDERGRVAADLREIAQHADVVITCGGVSAGDADFLPGVLGEIGRIGFWKVRMKPGMPVLFGRIGETRVFALPGNPVSAVVTFVALVQPALAALQGAANPLPPTFHVRLAAPVHKRHDRTEFLRAKLESRADGGLWATPLAKQGSGMLRSLVEAQVLLMIPEEVHELASGDVVQARTIGIGGPELQWEDP